MKAKEIVAMVLLAVLITSARANIKALDALINRVNSHISQTEELAQSGNWEQAINESKKAFSTWHEKEAYTMIFLNHDEADHAVIALFDFIQAVSTRDAQTVSIAAAALRDRFDGIMRMEELHLESIL